MRGRVRWLADNEGQKLQKLWTDIQRVGNTARERTGYPTQKPLALLDRIIKASSNPGDVVLDPFCGCATACVSAETLVYATVEALRGAVEQSDAGGARVAGCAAKGKVVNPWRHEHEQSRIQPIPHDPRVALASRRDCFPPHGGSGIRRTSPRTRGEAVADRCSPDKRSAIMASIRGTNTKPEMAVRRLVHRLGYRFRLHRGDLPGKPDLVLPKHRAVLFVHGCFWHQHNCRRGGRLPATNQACCGPKLAGNVERDVRVSRALHEMGWRVLTIWECQVDAARLGDQINRFLRGVAEMPPGTQHQIAPTRPGNTVQQGRVLPAKRAWPAPTREGRRQS